MEQRRLPIVLACAEAYAARARYVLDTLLLALGIPVRYADSPPAAGPWLLYGTPGDGWSGIDRCINIGYSPEAWEFFSAFGNVERVTRMDGLPVVLPERPAASGVNKSMVQFDVVANAFYFLSSWSERRNATGNRARGLYADSVFSRLGVEQDVVDQYLARLCESLDGLCDRLSVSRWDRRLWPESASYAVVLSHDVDFIPAGLGEIVKQGAKTIMRHIIRQRSPADAVLAGAGLVRALAQRRDPYGCIPEIIAMEEQLGVRASFQVAVGHRHPVDVNYYIERDSIRDYLRQILEHGLDLCLHGSYRSTENPIWYAEEVALLSERLAPPLGSRQHFLAFEYDTLFRVQEQVGIRYDMSIGYPDRVGPRAGFSYPYFPWCLEEDRPYDVLQLSLFLMDVTLRSYMGLRARDAWKVIEEQIEVIRRKGGGVSVVWHPIVFGGARDPGYEQLFWRMIRHVQGSGGLATDGRTINDFWRKCARDYPSFSGIS